MGLPTGVGATRTQDTRGTDIGPNFKWLNEVRAKKAIADVLCSSTTLCGPRGVKAKSFTWSSSPSTSCLKFVLANAAKCQEWFSYLSISCGSWTRRNKPKEKQRKIIDWTELRHQQQFDDDPNMTALMVFVQLCIPSWCFKKVFGTPLQACDSSVEKWSVLVWVAEAWFLEKLNSSVAQCCAFDVMTQPINTNKDVRLYWETSWNMTWGKGAKSTWKAVNGVWVGLLIILQPVPWISDANVFRVSTFQRVPSETWLRPCSISRASPKSKPLSSTWNTSFQ